MSLGGGNFTTPNKVLPGTYINFVSARNASATLADRGIATIGLEMDWGPEDTVLEVSSEDFQKKSLEIFGYPYDHEKLKGLRDLFLNIKTLYAYRLNGGGVKASNKYATALYSGTRGNEIKIVVQKTVDETEIYEVSTVLGSTVVDKQLVKASTELKANKYVTWKSFEVKTSVTAGEALTSGTNGNVQTSNHQAYLDKIEAYSFNTIGCVSSDDGVKGLYASFTKRMREEVGTKFQCVLSNKPADYEGVINVKNTCTELEQGLVYWVTGVSAGCAVNETNLNKVYDGEFTVNVNYTQSQLIKAIQDGEFTLHNVNGEVRVLEDINSLVTTTEEKGEDFKNNQTVRVLDQIGNDVAVIFNNNYLGKVPNDESGRTSLWADIVKHHEELQKLRAIEGFSSKDVVVEVGPDKKSVMFSDAVKPLSAMAKLYMVVQVG